ncbi:MAG: type II toxin-antitoxin system HicB family antitoxin [Acidobacteria bacterium]|nr:type II toxin-antitoxin system HicB family antitoxin [Acidobacteriota bacterium]
MNKYGISIYWSEEDQVFIAEVPELPGCMTHGDTKALALANADKAIQAWIDTATEFGDSIPMPKEERVASNKLVEANNKRVNSGRKLLGRRNNPRNFIYARASRPTVNPKAH